MSEENSMNNPIGGADGELEAALRRLLPAPGGHSAEKIAFAAGRRSERHRAAIWRGAASALAAGLALAIFLRPSPGVVERVVYVPAPEKSAFQVMQNGSLRMLPNSYLLVREHVLDYGIGALEQSGTSSPSEPAPRAIDVQPYQLHMPSFFGGNS